MPSYDFCILSPIDFEELARDLMQEHLNLHLESFKEGRDKGIDFRYAKVRTAEIIIQCKRYKSHASLIQALKGEVGKVKRLKPDRYIIVTSASLSPQNKDEIQQLFDGLLHDTGDIFGREDLNNLLSKYTNVEKKHFKLWLPSVSVLQNILHSAILFNSTYEVDELRNDIMRYVLNASYYDAMKALDKYNFVVISGIPGIGKTTLAKMLVYRYLQEGFELAAVSEDIEEAAKIYDQTKKQVIFYDDFLGRNFLEDTLKKNEDKRIVKFIELLKKVGNKKLIMTTREYILKQAFLKYETLSDSHIVYGKCIVDLEKYTAHIRAKILYNHLYYSDLPFEFIKGIIQNKNYHRIIKHENYNPRIIDIMTRSNIVKTTLPNQYAKKFIENLNNPGKIWENAFENHITESAQYVLYVLLTMGESVFLDDLELAFESFVKHESRTYACNRLDFNKSLKELEGTFTITEKIDKTNLLIQFQNPSIKDFLINYLRNQKRLIQALMEGAAFFNQLFTVFSALKRENTINLRIEQLEFLENLAIKRFHTLKGVYVEKISYGNNDYRWEKKYLKKLEKIEQLVTFFDIRKHPKLRHFIVDEMNKLLYDEQELHWCEAELLRILRRIKRYIKIDTNHLFNYLLESINASHEFDSFFDLERVFTKEYNKFYEKNEKMILEKIYEVIDSDIENLDNMDGLLYEVEKIERKVNTRFDKLKSRIEEKQNNYEPDSWHSFNEPGSKGPNRLDQYDTDFVDGMFASLLKHERSD